MKTRIGAWCRTKHPAPSTSHVSVHAVLSLGAVRGNFVDSRRYRVPRSLHGSIDARFAPYTRTRAREVCIFFFFDNYTLFFLFLSIGGVGGMSLFLLSFSCEGVCVRTSRMRVVLRWQRARHFAASSFAAVCRLSASKVCQNLWALFSSVCARRSSQSASVRRLFLNCRR